MTQDTLRILCIGLGGGSVPCRSYVLWDLYASGCLMWVDCQLRTFYAESLPHCQVDVVELEPAVLLLSIEYVQGNQIREWLHPV